MTASVLHFTPRAELEPQANLDAFIDLCQTSAVLGARSQFKEDVWTAGWLKGKKSAHRIVFSTLEAAREAESEPSLPQPFLDFAKAVLVYLQDKRPVVSQGPRIAALRCLEAALREWSKASRPTAATVDVLDTAVALAQQHLSPGVAYRVAGQIELIAEMMRSKGFIPLSNSWLHGLKKPSELGSRISKSALAARQEKLPSAAVLRALGGIFQDAAEPADVLVSSATALMLSAPERINEVLRLKRRCLVEGDGRFAGKLGLSWSGSKAADDTTKWLPTQMTPVAREAVAKLLKVTAPAQEIAAWYTANPTALFLHEAATHLRGKGILSLSEIALLLWGDRGARTSATTWAAQTANLHAVSMGANRVGYRFEDVERAVLAMLPWTFPYVPGDPKLRCMDAMFITRVNEGHVRKATYLCMFDCVDYNGLTNSLGVRTGRDSMFARFGYAEDDGTPIALRSHALRHYLNMLAQIGGLSSAEIAIFSGRKDVKHNGAYDHRTSDELQAPISQALKAGFTADLVPEGSRTLYTRSEFKAIGLRAAHTTDYGWCMHSFASEPCQMHRDCINCEEQECVKGEAHKEANLRIRKDQTEYLLQQAKEALSEEEFGADAWVKHQTRTLERVNALLSVMDDVDCPIGARIRLNITNAPVIVDDTVRPIHVVGTNRRKALQ